MSPREVNALLSYIEVGYDSRLKQEAADRAARATIWARQLEHVTAEDARAAVDDFYAAETRSITVADLVAACPVRSSSWAGNVTEQRLASERSEVMS